MSKTRFTRVDYFEAILVGVLVMVMIGLLCFLLLNTIPSYQVLLASFFVGVIVGGLLVRLRRTQPTQEPAEPWMAKGKRVEMAALVLAAVSLLLITLFEVAFPLPLLSFAVFAGLNLGGFFLALGHPRNSAMLVQGARQALNIIVFGLGVIYSAMLLFQELSYSIPTIGLVSLALMVTIAVSAYFIGRLAVS